MKELSRLAWISATVGFLSLLISIAGAFRDPGAFFQNYLFSFLFWSDLSIGALALAMIYPLTGGRWGAATRKILETCADSIPAVAMLCLPVLAGLKWIYPWMNRAVAAEPKIRHKHLYLNSEAFIARTAIYLVIWIGLSFLIKRFSQGSAEGASAEMSAKLRKLCGGGLVFLGLTVTFASIDWQMSVEPRWYSTIYGMVYAIGQAMSAYAFALVIFGIAAAKKGYQNLFPKKTLWDLGNILLMFVMVWAYLSFMQYLIVWSGNLPHEVTWYRNRTGGGWQWFTLILLIFQFSAPFLLLLFRKSKDQTFRLACLGGLVFIIRGIDHYWMLIPGLKPEHFEIHWEAITTWVGVGGVWLAVFVGKLKQGPIFAENDPAWPDKLSPETLPEVPILA